MLFPKLFGDVLLRVFDHLMSPVKLASPLSLLRAVFLLPIPVDDPNRIPVSLSVVARETFEFWRYNAIILHDKVLIFPKNNFSLIES